MKKHLSAHRCTGLYFSTGYGADKREASPAEIALAAKPWTFRVSIDKDGVNLSFHMSEQTAKYDRTLIDSSLSIWRLSDGRQHFYWSVKAERNGSDQGDSPHQGDCDDLDTAYADLIAALETVRALPILSFKECRPLVAAREEAKRQALEAKALDPSNSEWMREMNTASYIRQYGHAPGTPREVVREDRRQKLQARILDPATGEHMLAVLVEMYQDEFGHAPEMPANEVAA